MCLLLRNEHGCGEHGKVVGVVVDQFVGNHVLYLSASQHAPCSIFGLGKLMDIRVVPVLLVCQAAIDVKLAL